MEDLTSNQALDLARIVSQENAATIARLTLENAELRVRLTAALSTGEPPESEATEGES